MRTGTAILGIWVDDIQRSEITERIISIIRSESDCPKLIGSLQIHKSNIAAKNRAVFDYLNNCKLCYCDGNGVRWASILLGHPIKERMTAADFITEVLAECARNGYMVYILGGMPGVVERGLQKMRDEVPDLVIAGYHHGFFDIKDENDMIVADINRANADLLIVGMGIPRQEEWVMANLDKIEAGTIWALGATFDYFAGTQSRGPKFFRDHGHEWLGRLVSNPRHLAGRYLIGNPLFFLRVLHQRWLAKQT